MKQICVRASRDFDYRGTHYTAGQTVTLPLVEALSLARKRAVSLSKVTAAIAPTPEPEPERPKRRGGYRRRDLQAEPASEPAPAVILSTPVSRIEPLETSDLPAEEE